MRIALAQLQPVVGDISGNLQQILDAATQARVAGADVLVTPELALSGQAQDLLLRPDFLSACGKAIGRLIDEVDDITLVVGHPRKVGDEVFNCASIIRDGNVLGRYEKLVLAGGGPVDELRYFSPGMQPLVFEQNGVQLGLAISHDLDETDPVAAACDEGAQLLLVLSATPFHSGAAAQRQKLLCQRLEENDLAAVYVNAVGSADALLFEGQSGALSPQGETLLQLPAFKPALAYIDWVDGHLQPVHCSPPLETAALLWQALMLALRDAAGTRGVVVPSCDGLNDVLLLALAADALGEHRVYVADSAAAQDQLWLCDLDKSALARPLSPDRRGGDFAPWRDVTASHLQQLAQWRAVQGGDLGAMLVDVLATTPSTAADDQLLERYLRDRLGHAELIAAGHSPADIERVLSNYQRSARDRRVSAPGPRVSDSAEGIDVRWPLAQRFIHG
ncbi:nitrilase-related carbon-nitrogen hydrolase [Amantichitinum ursilacus]|uniref:Glutamine-dependent NAD(+) synthetase n=1 Tax=Amantichitinum ursilacus TaxID=857265 RepID=A0A0N0GKS1_9NEIS|nr:nitrilase-related carbon-nitrogen hydrolase [Amantichitinum ursilacus]KPC49114.1 Glutamine-dependent NAD(+) synthetase [Amantichitinum ursilacus]